MTGVSLFAIFQQLYLIYRLSTSYHEGYKIYFSSMWSYVDLVPPILMLIFLGNKFTGQTKGFTQQDSQFMSIVSLALWMKALYFLRIFPWSAFLVRMIIQCIIDVRVFGAIFLFSILAFANSFYILGRQVYPHPEGEDASLHGELPAPLFSSFSYAVMYTYKTSMGDWDTEAFGENHNSTLLLWFLWVSTTAIALIVLLNLLIAIVSETFVEIMATAEESTYQEKATIIRDLQSTRIIPIKT